ncbi:uncharacterized protein LOC143464516 [Clavelina lepadiformis]|uniref:uncharacterized protein LOC143464516 n=1 Tax=Clavelina lepadiformis TaxID=159417 RepID=UPI0040413EBD
MVSSAAIVTQLFVIGFIIVTSCLADYYSSYVSSILRNDTKSSCEGNYLYIRCPIMTTIAIQSAMYGRQVPSSQMCPIYSSILNTPATLLGKENTDCTAATSMAKTANECHDRRVCQLLVHVKEFGLDPCPDTTKYLKVGYKCRIQPNELQRRGSCRHHNAPPLRIRCPYHAPHNTVIAVYNVSIEQKAKCGERKNRGCHLSHHSVMDEIIARCHRQQKCAIPMTRKLCGNYLQMEYSCLPKSILTNKVPSSELMTIPLSEAKTPATSKYSTTTIITTSSSTTAAQTTTTTTTARYVKPKIISPIIKTDTNQSKSRIFQITQQSRVSTTTLETTDTTSTTDFDASGEERNSTLVVVVETKPADVTSARTTAKPTLEFVREGEKFMEAENDFPQIEDDEFERRFPSTQRNNRVGATTTTQEFFLEDQTSLSNVVNVVNTSMPAGLAFMYGFAQTITYMKSHSDRFLAVLFGSLCVALFLTVLVLLLRCEHFSLFEKVASRKNLTSNEDDSAECARFFPETEQTSPTATNSASGGNFYNAQTSAENSDGQANHIQLINHINDRNRHRKHQSRKHVLLNRWCSCCCRNAPWQRGHVEDDGSYEIARRSTSLSDDEIISVGPGERNNSENDHFPPFPINLLETTDGNFQAFSTNSRGGITCSEEDDTRSEYEYPDHNITSTPSQHSDVMQNNAHSFHTHIPANNSSAHTFQPVQSARHSTYETPPFPKTANQSYEVQPRSVHLVQNINYSLPNRQRTIANNCVMHPPLTPQSPAFNAQYVSLQPQTVKARNLPQRSLDARLEHRESIYDNSLPRDSPIYEYYQRQQMRQELPGTRNINRYYS